MRVVSAFLVAGPAAARGARIRGRRRLRHSARPQRRAPPAAMSKRGTCAAARGRCARGRGARGARPAGARRARRPRGDRARGGPALSVARAPRARSQPPWGARAAGASPCALPPRASRGGESAMRRCRWRPRGRARARATRARAGQAGRARAPPRVRAWRLFALLIPLVHAFSPLRSTGGRCSRRRGAAQQRCARGEARRAMAARRGGWGVDFSRGGAAVARRHRGAPR